jgi:hypothetical protein
MAAISTTCDYVTSRSTRRIARFSTSSWPSRRIGLEVLAYNFVLDAVTMGAPRFFFALVEPPRQSHPGSPSRGGGLARC